MQRKLVAATHWLTLIESSVFIVQIWTLFILQAVVQIWTGFDHELLKILGMAKAGAALKQVLKAYGISQNKLATTMGISHSNIHRWINEVVDPAGDSILDIWDALRTLNPEAAEEFKRLYWDGAIEGEE